MENFKETRICHLSCRISHFVVVLIVKSRGVVGFLFLLLHLFLQKKKKKKKLETFLKYKDIYFQFSLRNALFVDFIFYMHIV